MRNSIVERCTKETNITVELNLDGVGNYEIKTPFKFFTHMLEQFAAHSGFELKIDAQSLDNDFHHLVEDVAIALGDALLKALDNKKGIKRYGQRFIPMDEALSLCVIDISGRAFSRLDVNIKEEKISDFETIMLPHFFNSLAQNAKINIQIKTLYGDDGHHIIESIFKSFAHALSEAVSVTNGDKILSTKGVL